MNGIGTSYPKIATNFQSLYLAEIFALVLWNLSWWLLLPSSRFSQIFTIFRQALEICDSSFGKFSKIIGPYDTVVFKQECMKLFILLYFKKHAQQGMLNISYKTPHGSALEGSDPHEFAPGFEVCQMKGTYIGASEMTLCKSYEIGFLIIRPLTLHGVFER